MNTVLTPVRSGARNWRPALWSLLLLLALTAQFLPPALTAAAKPNPVDWKYPKPLEGKQSKVRTLSPLRLATTSQPAEAPSMEPKATGKTIELIAKRSRARQVFVDSNGARTEKHYLAPHFYNDNGQWKTISTTVAADTKPSSYKIVPGGSRSEDLKSQKYLAVYKNDWQVRFAPSYGNTPMLRLQHHNEVTAFSPVGANSARPEVSTRSDGTQVVMYRNLWEGVDVEYYVEADALKQNVILASVASETKFSFKVSGSKLKARPSKRGGGYEILSRFKDGFNVSGVNLILNTFGVETTHAPIQKMSGNVLTVTLDRAYLRSLPKEAFPAVVDPGFYRSTYGTRGSGNFQSFKSDGYICPASVCNTQAGALFDTNGALRYWRSAYFAPYEFARTNEIRSANLHLTQRSNESFWTGTPGAHDFQVGHATCLNSFNCVDGIWAHGTVNWTGDINVTDLYRAMVQNGDFGAWMMIMGEDGTTSSYKNIDPNNSFVDFSYNFRPTIPAPELPSKDPNAQVTLTTQTPQLQISASSDPDGDGLTYRFGVRDSNGVTVWQTDWNATRQWIVPDGLLQDGGGYTWQYAVNDGYWSSAWQSGGSFKVDLRIGKDRTQTYDTVGPASISLSNGNLFTDVDTHSINALGGIIGISLNYNSPVASRRGLVAEYFNGTNWGTTPNYRRIEPNININWDLGSPAAGVISADSFSARWTGYFVAPKTGSYSFGTTQDDVLSVYVLGQLASGTTECTAKACYGSAVSLQAGQPVSFKAEYIEATGPAYANVFVKGVVDEQVARQDWFRTAPYATSQESGLTGTYYYDDGSHNSSNFEANKFMVRTDPSVNFDWGTNAPVPGAPQDGFYVRWSGYFRVPADGSYSFGAGGDDGYRLKINGQVVTENWSSHGYLASFGTGIPLTAGTNVSISLDYYEAGGPGSVKLLLNGPGNSGQPIDPQYLIPSAKVVPPGWSISADADGNLAYDRLSVRQNGDVLLYDPDGTEHLYTTTGTGYKPPANEDGILARNGDGSFQLVDDDGRIYTFNVDGTLRETSIPTDSRKPAALKYVYSTQNSIPKLTSITDGVDASRGGRLYYAGDDKCAGKSGMPTVPAGFDTSPPNGYLCAFVTSDDARTDVFYKNGALARVVAPGAETYDMAYDAASGLLTGVRDVAANDAIAAGVRANDASTTTEVTYDSLARASVVTAPGASATATRVTDKIEYLPSSTKRHVSDASEPNGYSQYIEYDNLQRTTKACDAQALCTYTEWDPQKDLELSSKDASGLQSTTIYDSNDMPTDTYGPAPSAWFGTDRLPVADKLTQVPHTATTYDEGIIGPSVGWYDYRRVDGNPSGSLFSSPKLYTTGVTSGQPGALTGDLTQPPITPSAGMQGVGFRASGKLRLPAGTYRVNADTSEGVRVWIDDTLVLDAWADAAYRSLTGGSSR